MFWDRWELAPPWVERMRLDELLAARAPDTELMLDLKGRGPRVAHAVAAELDGRPVTVCSQNWRALDVLSDLADVRIVHSVGSARALERLRRRDTGQIEGISIHRKLLDPAVVADLRERAPLVMSWPVRTEADAHELAAWGVQGLIATDFERISSALSRRRVAA